MAVDPNYGSPTMVDILHASAYAMQQINKMKCMDPDVITAVCTQTGAGGGTCLTWVDDKSVQAFPTPQNYYVKACSVQSDCIMGKCDTSGNCRCTVDSDCNMGMKCIPDPNSPQDLICGYAPSTVAGHCIFNNEMSCLAQGQLPYTCDCGPHGNNVGSCTTLPKEQLNKSYTEWHIDPTTNQGTCVMGNFALRQWCENPCTRCALNTSTNSYPPECTQGNTTMGVTNVPPFYYDRHSGTCYMTFDYCDHYAFKYNQNSCSSDADCPNPGSTCDLSALKPHCVGPGAACYLTKGEQAAEFVVGRTLFYMFKKGVCIPHSNPLTNPSTNPLTNSSTNPPNEPFEPDNRPISTENIIQAGRTAMKQFSSGPNKACMIYNPALIEKKKVIGRDFFAPGIHLYLYSMNGNRVITGVEPNELKLVYPELVQEQEDGNAIICITKEEIKQRKNKGLNRLYVMLNSKTWMAETIVKMAQSKHASL